MAKPYTIVVIGGGGVGSAAAYHLARSGQRVLLLEQFAIGHVRGSSHGESRIIRHSYGEADYASLAPASFAMWRTLEDECGMALLQMTGGVDIGAPGHPQFSARVAALSALGIPFRVLEGPAVAAALPQFRLPTGWAALEQAGAGILHASRCVRAMADSAVANGAVLREHAPVHAVRPDGNGVAIEVVGPKGVETILADRAIIAAGPWAGHFFAQLGLPTPLRVTHQQVAYFPVENTELFELGRCPVYIFCEEPVLYGFPICERPGQIKVSLELDGAAIDPDAPPLPPDAAALARLCDLVRERMVGLGATPSDVVTCRYTVSPDHDFVIDRHPQHPQIVLASPCSGHGFKFTIASGRLLADLATSEGYSSPLWRDRFALTRLALHALL